MARCVNALWPLGFECANPVMTTSWVQEQEEWRPLALMVAQFEAAMPARFNKAGPRAVQYVPPPPPHPSDKARPSP